MAFALWIFWWFTSQQSRWLYPVMALGLLATISTQKRVNQRLLLGSLIVSAMLSALSLARSIDADFYVSSADVQAHLQASVDSNPETGVAKRKEMLYVEHVVTSVEDVDGLFIFPVDNK